MESLKKTREQSKSFTIENKTNPVMKMIIWEVLSHYSAYVCVDDTVVKYRVYS